MSEAREEILARVRSALEPDRPDVPVATQPALATVDPAAMLEEFLETTADYRAVVERCPAAEVPARVAAALESYAARRVVSPPGLPADWLTAYAGEVVVDEGLSAYDLDRLDAVCGGNGAGDGVVREEGEDRGHAQVPTRLHLRAHDRGAHRGHLHRHRELLAQLVAEVHVDPPEVRGGNAPVRGHPAGGGDPDRREPAAEPRGQPVEPGH